MADFLSSLFSSLPSIISELSGSADPYRQQQEALAQQQMRYSSAAANPNDPLYKSTYSQYDQQNRNNLAQVIAEAQRQNRSQSRMGRQPLFAPERGSENLFRTLMQGYQDSGVQSDKQTRDSLTSAGNLGQQAAQQYEHASPWTAMGSAQKVLGYEGIGNLFNQQGSIFAPGDMRGNGSGGYQTLDNGGSQNINWAQNNYADLLRQRQPSYNSWAY